MGIEMTHGCFEGPASHFVQWRRWLAQQIGVPLGMMEGHVKRFVTDEEVKVIETMIGPAIYREPVYSGMCVLRAMENIEGIKWEILGKDPLLALLISSDCGGHVRWWEAKEIALRLLQVLRGTEKELDETPGVGNCDGMYQATRTVALGLLRAYKVREDVRWTCKEPCGNSTIRPAAPAGMEEKDAEPVRKGSGSAAQNRVDAAQGR